MPDYKILILDYEPRGIQQLQVPLENAGYEVHVAKDGVAGMEAFRALEPDLTLIEAMLPRKHGFEVCQELKKTPHGSTSPIVIVTSVYKGRKYRTQALHHYGCDEYLEKPIAADLLLDTVERLLEQSRSPVGGSGPAPDPSAPPAPQGSSGTAENEISDRLEQLLGGPDAAGSGSSAAAAAADEDGDGEPKATVRNVVSFERGRTQKQTDDRSPVTVLPSSTISGHASAGTASRLELEAVPVRSRPEKQARPTPHEEIRPDRIAQTRPQPAVNTGIPWWIWTLVVTVLSVAGGALVYLIVTDLI